MHGLTASKAKMLTGRCVNLVMCMHMLQQFAHEVGFMVLGSFR